MSERQFPDSADVVIVGVGGIVGGSLAYFLSELGVRNIVGLEKAGSVPSDIGSTSHASDFIFNTGHDKLSNWTTAYSRNFYAENGFFFERGGMEICRPDDPERWEELKRKVASGKAFGTNARLISAREATEKFPLLEESAIRGAMWDPNAGLVVPRSLDFVLEMVSRAEKKGNLGYNIDNDKYVDMLEAGILDPTKVTRSALQHAASISGLLLTTECLITEIPEETPAAAPPAGPPGGGMY